MMNKLNKTETDLDLDDRELIKQIAGLSEEDLAMFLGSLSDEELEEFEQKKAEMQEEQSAKLDSLCETLAKKRSEAIKDRQNSGIEDEWLEDEEFYEGIDDANRGDNKAWSSKPVGRVADDSGDDTSSNIFLNITGPYCDAAGASLADMLLPTDDSAWQISPTPFPEMIPFADGDIPKNIKASVMQETMAGNGGNQEAAQQQAQEIEAKLVNDAKELVEKAKKKAQKAQQRIEDWHVECQYHAEVRKVIEDAARIGSGVLKGPIPMKKRQFAYKEGSLIVQEEIKPASKRIDYRNLFPSPGCSETIHDGSYIFERDEITSKQLRDLIGIPGYLEDQINAVLEEGPTEAGQEYQPVDNMKSRKNKGVFEIWYFYGDLDKEDMEAAGCECEGNMTSIPAQMVMVNNRVIKAVMSHLDTGEFPYDVMVWKKRRGMPWGMGIARLIRTAQRMINGAARNLMDNAGLAGGPMWAFKQGLIRPIDGVAELAPRKGWVADEDADIEDIQKAFTYFKMDMMVNELQAIIHLGLKMAEDVTGLPMIMQGQMGAQRIDTLGQTQILNNNANIVRRRIARLFDDLVTEPHVRRYYAYLLQYGEDEEKGEFIIDARGSSNLVERAIQKEKTIELLNLANNPVYGIDPKKAATEYLRSEKFDPKLFEYDDEEWKQIVENMANQQAQDPRLQVAEMNNATKKEIEQMKLESDQADRESKERIASMKGEIDKAITIFEGGLKKRLAELDFEGSKNLQFDKLKKEINETVMRLTTQRELSYMGAKAKNMPTPPTEPAGRAPTGMSYQR